MVTDISFFKIPVQEIREKKIVWNVNSGHAKSTSQIFIKLGRHSS